MNDLHTPQISLFSEHEEPQSYEVYVYGTDDLNEQNKDSFIPLMAEKGTDHSLTYPILRDEGRYGSSICRTVPYFQLCFHVNFFYFSVNSRDAVGSVRLSGRTLPKASHTFLLVLFDS